MSTKIIKDPDRLSCEERLSNLGLFSLEERILDVDLTNVYLHLREVGVKQMRPNSVMCSDRTKTSGLKLEHRKLHTTMQKNFFTVRVMEHWSRLSRGAVDSLSSGDVQGPSSAFLCSLL